ncbi:Probable amino-acid import ATP-binding protein YxeO [Acholeplasma oculi]|uniref:Glutamine transport, ATP-binding protein GlnQ n=1 Tax=Acholeplasma oculi TaxID=35623 RepID=A0A061A8X9_9MOLU|nr:ATP-binding cassette domain-containing protein [Acholeplasma oculi]CDR30298.1 Glutamine transport, ATP-binding protein GlnQ [Acholeplasma oculi]SKC43239.1 polar amino acid transport system ATP-binding protein [Acholeplasma oculi]SUT88746.1 Probable amino-acid import ATP-binding protein YxeO [Acholeplasma oculi]
MKINIKNVTHRYDVEVLKELNLDLEGYQSIAIIGVSGSGKSTLIRLLSGLEKPSQGELYLNSYNVMNEDYKKSIGFVFQNHNLFPHLTLKKNITLVLEKTRGFSKEDASITASKYLSLLHLEDQEDKLPKNVSGGQAQRASIARALSVNPNVIFMDEPTSSLDPILTHEVLNAVKELKTIGKDFIFVTHEMSFVKDFADYVIFMHQGEIKEMGTPSILNTPQTEELKLFMEKVR